VAAATLFVAVTAAGAWRLARRSTSRAVDADEQDAIDERTATYATRLLAAAGVMLGSYLAVLIASRILADPGIPFDERIFSPIILLATTMAAVGIAHWWRSTPAVLPKIALTGALLGWWFAAASVTHDEAVWALDMGSDFAGEEWRKSALLDWARTDGERHPLFSNWPAVAYFYLRRPARDVPLGIESAKMAAFADTLRVRDGRILEFRVPGPEYATIDSLRRVPGLRVVAEFPDGVVFAPASGPPAATTPAPSPTAGRRSPRP
jgi:hypothetical protein